MKVGLSAICFICKQFFLGVFSVGCDACLGEKMYCETLVEMVLVMLVVESEVIDWVGGSDFTCIVTRAC